MSISEYYYIQQLCTIAWFFLSLVNSREVNRQTLWSTHIFSVRVAVLFFDQIYILRGIQEPRVSCDHAAWADFPATSELFYSTGTTELLWWNQCRLINWIDISRQNFPILNLDSKLIFLSLYSNKLLLVLCVASFPLPSNRARATYGYTIYWFSKDSKQNEGEKIEWQN